MSRRLFVRDKEVNFFNVLGKELIQDIVGQKIIYYAVSDKLTQSDPLYGEATKKTVFTPIEINALIRYNEPDQKVSQFSFDTVYSIEIYFLINELLERGVVPHEGDFVQYGKTFYEVEKLTRPQTTYGRIENQVQVRAICRVAREGQFKLPPIKKST